MIKVAILGYGTVGSGVFEIINENKIPCLFYDNIEAGKIYNKLGFKEKGYWGIYYR